jgi:hypothetical protein
MAIQTPYEAPSSRRNARVTAQHNIQYAADDVSGIFELASTDPETLSALPKPFMPGRYSGVSHDEFGKRTPKHTKILKLYGEANAVFS